MTMEGAAPERMWYAPASQFWRTPWPWLWTDILVSLPHIICMRQDFEETALHL